MGKQCFVGIDLFSGAGGMSLGAELAGVSAQYAVEKDIYAAQTYQLNHPNTIMLNSDIREIVSIPNDIKDSVTVLFGERHVRVFLHPIDRQTIGAMRKIGYIRNSYESFGFGNLTGLCLRMLQVLWKWNLASLFPNRGRQAHPRGQNNGKVARPHGNTRDVNQQRYFMARPRGQTERSKR
jgi:hypothetical protein